MKCSGCKRESSVREEICPRCGTPAKRRILSVLLAVCCGLIGTMLVVGAAAAITRWLVKREVPPVALSESTLPASTLPAIISAPEAPSPLPNNATNPGTCLEFLSLKGFYDESSSKISGHLKNNCERSFRYVHIRFKILDSARNIVGAATAEVTQLQIGGTRPFIAQGVVAGKTFELDQVTGL
jgi:hypothetical protein